MAVTIPSTNSKGEPIQYLMDNYLIKALEAAKYRVIKKKWDYVSITCGLPGSGKSTFARTAAKFCCDWFCEKYIAFTADEFVNITNEAPEFSSVILDESFASMNTQVSKSPDFLRIVNHLQLIRQKHLFIFLCLPDFFSLNKGIAIFRSSHLFVTYAEDNGTRGRFLAFGRNAKRMLYVKGNRFIDYYCVKANFRGQFFKNSKICDEVEYNDRKLSHLKDQDKKIVNFLATDTSKALVAYNLYLSGVHEQKIADSFDVDSSTVSKWINKMKGGIKKSEIET